MASSPSISTVYVQNLEERVKIPQLSGLLRTLFSEFGTVVDIVAKKNLKAKGQAFIVYDDPANAKSAIDELQGFKLFDKPMRLSLAKSRSDKSVEIASSSEVYELYKRNRLAEKDKRLVAEAADNERRSKQGHGQVTSSRLSKLSKPPVLKPTGPMTSQVVPDEYLPPNRTLFIQQIPDGYDVDALHAIYSRFEGFREIRFVPGRRGLAFVEYAGEQAAIAARESTSGMKLGESSLKVSFQRQ
ncbi:hypothetical protein E4U17_001362 [Claviceps sp. LM77 group G4]|nr:hypothetical protein E4U17_001362 [Claviceps sp. LM77 group G4]KAG6057544.1 hypothetical protein E4U33_007477 [Claviceps sp. LM78 group G4]KAG6070066.1 hypothetical protein E4U16_007177 [Claviceps sp. LM84 group G4]